MGATQCCDDSERTADLRMVKRKSLAKAGGRDSSQLKSEIEGQMIGFQDEEEDQEFDQIEADVEAGEVADAE